MMQHNCNTCNLHSSLLPACAAVFRSRGISLRVCLKNLERMRDWFHQYHKYANKIYSANLRVKRSEERCKAGSRVKPEMTMISTFRTLTFGACILSNAESSETACHVCHAAESIWFCQCRAAFVLMEARSSISPTRDLHIVNAAVNVLQDTQVSSVESLLSIEGKCILDNSSWARFGLHIVWGPGCCTWELLIAARKISSLHVKSSNHRINAPSDYDCDSRRHLI